MNMSFSMTKVCHLTSHHAPQSVRIFKKQCVSLAKSGYQVFYVVPGSGKQKIDGVTLKYFKRTPGIFGRLFINPWKACFSAIIINADIYHFHDPELMFFAYILKLAGKKVIYDVHEDLVAKCSDLIFNNFFFMGYFFIRLIELIEKFFSHRFDLNIFAELGYSLDERMVRRFPSKKTEVIGNYPIMPSYKYVSEKKNILTLVYAGSLTNIRGIREVLYAVELVKYPIRFVLMGTWKNIDFKHECMRTKGWDHCDYLGQVSLETVYNKFSESHIGIATLYPQGNYLHSMPTKAFDYMVFGLPVIMSDFPFWREKFNGCAMFVDSQNSSQIADAITKLAENPTLRASMGNKGNNLIQKKYSWEAESKKLYSIYKKIENKK